MANWNSSELQTPAPIKKIGEDAQTLIDQFRCITETCQSRVQM